MTRNHLAQNTSKMHRVQKFKIGSGGSSRVLLAQDGLQV